MKNKIKKHFLVSLFFVAFQSASASDGQPVACPKQEKPWLILYNPKNLSEVSDNNLDLALRNKLVIAYYVQVYTEPSQSKFTSLCYSELYNEKQRRANLQ